MRCHACVKPNEPNDPDDPNARTHARYAWQSLANFTADAVTQLGYDGAWFDSFTPTEIRNGAVRTSAVACHRAGGFLLIASASPHPPPRARVTRGRGCGETERNRTDCQSPHIGRAPRSRSPSWRSCGPWGSCRTRPGTRSRSGTVPRRRRTCQLETEP